MAVLLLTICSVTHTASAEAQIKTDKDRYLYGETIKVIFYDAPGNKSDWICIVPEGSPDNEAGDYKYIPSGLNQGELTFNSPKPGQYEARAFYNYSRRSYAVTARCVFDVVDGSSLVKSQIPPRSKQKKPKTKQGEQTSDTTHSLTQIAGQGTRMVGEVMETLGKENEGTAVGGLLTKGGQLHKAIGTGVEKSADNNEGIGGAYGAAMNAGTDWLNNPDSEEKTSKQKKKKAGKKSSKQKKKKLAKVEKYDVSTVQATPKKFMSMGVFTSPVIGAKFILIPAGEFTMGSNSNEQGQDNDESPQHQVTISRPFYLQNTEVTQKQWKIVMGNNSKHTNACGDDCPVVNVSWEDVQDFIKRLNEREGTDKYRLPTEAEWEYSVRAGNQGIRYGVINDVAWYDKNSGNSIHAVGKKQPNNWGMFDMLGNAWEWCQDWKDDYPSESVLDPKGPSSGFRRVIRGGAYDDYDWRARAAYRSSASRSYENLGFRIARTL